MQDLHEQNVASGFEPETNKLVLYCTILVCFVIEIFVSLLILYALDFVFDLPAYKLTLDALTGGKKEIPHVAAHATRCCRHTHVPLPQPRATAAHRRHISLAVLG